MPVQLVIWSDVTSLLHNHGGVGRTGQQLQQTYSVTNSTGATQGFSANHKMSSEQKNRSSFISDQIQMRGQI